MTFHARITVSEVDKPYGLTQEMFGAMPCKWIWNLAQDGSAVKVDFCIEYSVPGGFLGKIADKLLLARLNEKNLEGTLKNLKVYCEN